MGSGVSIHTICGDDVRAGRWAPCRNCVAGEQSNQADSGGLPSQSPQRSRNSSKERAGSS